MTDQGKTERRADDSGKRAARRVRRNSAVPVGAAAAVFVGSGVYLLRGSASSREGFAVWGRGAQSLRLRRFAMHGHALIDAAIYTPTASGGRRIRDEVRGLALPVEVWRILIAEVSALIDAIDEEAAGEG